jgi:peptide/nickel transport system ATP-binding protein
MTAPALEIDRLSVTFEDFVALKEVSLTVAPGESFGLVGESGSGKSTLLRAVAGLSPISGGTIQVNGKTLDGRRSKEFYRQVQMVFQDPYGSLHPRQTVDRLLLEPLAIHGFARALILEPSILLLDEPTSALDASVQAEVLNLLEEVRAARNLTFIMVSHDLAVVTHMCDRLMVMQHGREVELLASADLVSRNVSQDYTRNLLVASEGFQRSA